MKNLGLWASLILLVGCGGSEELAKEVAFLDAAPDIDAYMAEVTGDSVEGNSKIVNSIIKQAGSRYLVITQEGIAELNQAVRTALNPIASLVKEESGTISANSIQWGPIDYENGTYKFRIVRVQPKTFGWKLEAKPKGADDVQYLPVVAGGIRLGSVARRGTGVLGIDADALAKVEPSLSCQGKLLMAFVHGQRNGRAFAYTLENFTWNTQERQPVSALIRAVRGPAGATIVRMVAYADVSDPQNNSPELVLSRVRWLPGIGGRADALVFNGAEPQDTGDIPEGNFWVVNSCWDALRQETGKRVRECAEGKAINDLNCTESVSMDEGFCVTAESLKEKLPSSDPHDAPGEGKDEGLEDPTAIGAMPDGSGEDI